MADVKLFVATPLHDIRVHLPFMAGCLQLMAQLGPSRVAIEVQSGSWLPRNRDLLTSRFLDSAATHMLCVDSDIGFTPDDAQKLVETGKDFVSGVYCCKQADRKIPAKLTGETDGELLSAYSVPAGFLLLSRSCIERMVGAYRHLQYKSPWGYTWALWAPLFEKGVDYSGEDVAFCKRWTALGEKIWVRPDVILRHIGDQAFLPDGELRFS